MAGIYDGHFLEERSTPLTKLEVDVVALEDFNIFLGSFSNLESRVVALETDHPSLMAHLLKPISTAHAGEINVATQIPNNSIGTDKVSFTVLTLGTGHNQAAHGDHLHDDRYALASDLHNNYVTLDTNQTITGQKTFTNAVFVDTQNFQTSDQMFRLNTDHTTAMGDFASGIAVNDPSPRPGFPAGADAAIYYSSVDKKWHIGHGPISPGDITDNNTLATVHDINVFAAQQPSGSIGCPNGVAVPVDLSPPIPGFNIMLSIEQTPGPNNGSVGELFWYRDSSQPNSRFWIQTTGSGSSAIIHWKVI